MLFKVTLYIIQDDYQQQKTISNTNYFLCVKQPNNKKNILLFKTKAEKLLLATMHSVGWQHKDDFFPH